MVKNNFKGELIFGYFSPVLLEKASWEDKPWGYLSKTLLGDARGSRALSLSKFGGYSLIVLTIREIILRAPVDPRDHKRPRIIQFDNIGYFS